MPALLATIPFLFRSIMHGDSDLSKTNDGLFAKVTAADSSHGMATLTLCVMPKETRFQIEGDMQGLSEGDFITFHLKKNLAVWKGHELHIAKVEFVP